MAVIDLYERTTNDWNEYNTCIKEPSSKLLVSGEKIFDNDGSQCLNFTVGLAYYHNSRRIEIPKKGIKILSKEVYVIETEQIIAVPLNMFGLVYGIGQNIFNGCFISPGKIDPGFKGKLKLGFFNGGTETIILKCGDAIASASFWDIEKAIEFPLQDYHDAILPVAEIQSKWKSALKWLQNNWYSLLALIISLATLFATMWRS